MHADPTRAIFKGKTLLYGEESMLRWVLSGGALPLVLPRPGDSVTAADLIGEVDGLLLQGGVDMAPQSYGETPLRPEWSGDAARDAYEVGLVGAAIAAGKPVLGVCRGAQVLNVALGGSLFQDIATQHPDHRVHRDWEVYDQLVHRISFEPGSWLAQWYPEESGPVVNSVHHQGLDRIAPDLRVEARSVPDGVVEAVRCVTPGAWVYGVQWHPEFMHGEATPGLDPGVLLRVFLSQARSRAEEGR